MKHHFPVLPSSKISTEFPQSKPAALHRLTGKGQLGTTHALNKPSVSFFRVVFQEWLGEKERGTEERSSISSIPGNRFVQCRCNMDPEDECSARWWWVPQGCKAMESRACRSKWGPCPQAVLLNWVLMMANAFSELLLSWGTLLQERGWE